MVSQQVGEGEGFQLHQGSHSLRSLGRDRAAEDRIRQQQRLGVRADLRQQSLGALLGRLAEENRLHPQPAAQSLLQQAHSLDGTISVSGKFGLGKAVPKLLDERVLSTANLS